LEEYTPYQRKVIKDYYRNQKAIKFERLQAAVTELYLSKGGKADRLWAKVLGLLRELGCPPARADYIERTRDLADLSRAVSELF
jgi:hypothetical protein